MNNFDERCLALNRKFASMGLTEATVLLAERLERLEFQDQLDEEARKRVSVISTTKRPNDWIMHYANMPQIKVPDNFQLTTLSDGRVYIDEVKM